jgi:ribonuclease VapC
MIVDSSALVAVIKREPDWIAFSHAMDAVGSLSIPAASYLETAIVVDGLRDPVQSAKLDELLLDMEMTVEPVTAEQARIARQAYRDYGKGSGHRANLNFGDCFAYALARVKREPLLFKGECFMHTDVRPAIPAIP